MKVLEREWLDRQAHDCNVPIIWLHRRRTFNAIHHARQGGSGQHKQAMDRVAQSPLQSRAIGATATQKVSCLNCLTTAARSWSA